MRNELWQLIKLVAIDILGHHCARCGLDCSEQPGLLHVDHIYPKCDWPERRFDTNNLQILCADCNREKGTDTFDYRSFDQRGTETQRLFRCAAMNSVSVVLEQQKSLLILSKTLSQKGKQ